jgi:prolyl oligopeptidase
VWQGVITLYPKHERGLVLLSRGGGDAAVVREFDLLRKEFVPNGFILPEAKSQVAWRDKDTLYVGTDFGPGSLTSSGYPRLVKEWKRGTALKEAQTIYEGKQTDVSVGASVDHDHGHTYEQISRGITFGSVEQSVGENAGEEGLSASTAERRELRLASRRSARLAR